MRLFFYLLLILTMMISCSGRVDENSEEAFLSSDYSTSWTKQMGTSSDDRTIGVATDSSDNVYVTGHTQEGLDGNTSAGGRDIFVVKYDSDGNKQ